MNKRLPDNLLQSMKHARIRHRNYEEADRLIRSNLTFANDGTIILFIGPSKSGKTAEIEDLLADHKQVGDFIPMIATDATTIGTHFSMLHLTYRLLSELEHPQFVTETIDAWKASKGPPKMTETRARILLETGLILRKCRVIAIDESQQMVNSMTQNKVMHAIESFKCLMHLPTSLQARGRSTPNESAPRRIGILAGGYSMLDDGLTSEHFKNRIVPVHIPRYQNNQNDRDEFARALVTLDEIFLPDLRPGGSLVDFEDLIYHGIFGCFGNACNWVLLAIAKKRASQDRYLKAEHLSETRLELQLEETLADIIAGEKRMETISKNFSGFDVDEASSDERDEGVAIRKQRSRPKGKRFPVPRNSK